MSQHLLNLTLTREDSYSRRIFFDEDFSKRLPYRISILRKPRETVPKPLGGHTTLETGLYHLCKDVFGAERYGWTIEGRDNFIAAINDLLDDKIERMNLYRAKMIKEVNTNA
jgi:hypothetical protein